MEFALYWDTPGDSLMFEIFLLKVWKLFFFQNFIAFPLNTWNLMAICLLQKIGWWSKLLFGKCLQLTISILFRLVGFRVQGKCLFLSMCLVLGLLSLQIFCGKGVGLLFGSAANKAPKNGRKNPGGDWCTGKGNNWNFAKYVLDKYIGFFFRENPNLTTQQKPTHTHTHSYVVELGTDTQNICKTFEKSHGFQIQSEDYYLTWLKKNILPVRENHQPLSH